MLASLQCLWMVNNVTLCCTSVDLVSFFTRPASVNKIFLNLTKYVRNVVKCVIHLIWLFQNA